MKKNQKILLGVAVVAALGLFLYSENKKKKGEGYSNSTGSCRICERENGSSYFAVQGSCESGHKCIVSNRTKSIFSSNE